MLMPSAEWSCIQREAFQGKGIELKFIKAKPLVYSQFGGEFVPWLSIIDVMMFNSKEAIRGQLHGFELIR